MASVDPLLDFQRLLGIGAAAGTAIPNVEAAGVAQVGTPLDAQPLQIDPNAAAAPDARPSDYGQTHAPDGTVPPQPGQPQAPQQPVQPLSALGIQGMQQGTDGAQARDWTGNWNKWGAGDRAFFNDAIGSSLQSAANSMAGGKQQNPQALAQALLRRGAQKYG